MSALGHTTALGGRSAAMGSYDDSRVAPAHRLGGISSWPAGTCLWGVAGELGKTGQLTSGRRGHVLWCLCDGAWPRGGLSAGVPPPPTPQAPGTWIQMWVSDSPDRPIRVSGDGSQDFVFLQVPRVQFGGPALELPGLSCGYFTR